MANVYPQSFALSQARGLRSPGFECALDAEATASLGTPWFPNEYRNQRVRMMKFWKVLLREVKARAVKFPHL